MKSRSTLIAFISALLLHIIVGTLLLLNMNFSNIKPKPKNEVPIINATVVDQKLFDDLAQRKNEKKEAERKKVEEEKQRIEQEKQRIQQEKKKAADLRIKKENQRIQAEKAETLRKEKEAARVVAEKKRAAEQLKAKQDAEKAKKIANEKREKQQAENARKQAEEKRKKVEAQKIAAEKAAAKAKVEAKQEKERLRRAELDKQMEAQFENTFANAQSSRQLSEIARYTALIQDKISRNWQTEPSMKGKSCTLRIRLAVDGLVISAKQSSGDLKLCESARRAALKANTLPIPKDPDISTQFRDFDITVVPDF
jgi:colicin import membrane protein